MMRWAPRVELFLPQWQSYFWEQLRAGKDWTQHILEGTIFRFLGTWLWFSLGSKGVGLSNILTAFWLLLQASFSIILLRLNHSAPCSQSWCQHMYIPAGLWTHKLAHRCTHGHGQTLPYGRILDINIGEGTGHSFLEDFLLVSCD